MTPIRKEKCDGGLRGHFWELEHARTGNSNREPSRPVRTAFSLVFLCERISFVW
jgi:hypothetical protein